MLKVEELIKIYGNTSKDTSCSPASTKQIEEAIRRARGLLSLSEERELLDIEIEMMSKGIEPKGRFAYLATRHGGRR